MTLLLYRDLARDLKHMCSSAEHNTAHITTQNSTAQKDMHAGYLVKWSPISSFTCTKSWQDARQTFRDTQASQQQSKVGYARHTK